MGTAPGNGRRRHPDLDFVVLAGDLVDRGNERTNWDHLFLRAAPVFDRLPVMPCAGNHEYLDIGPRLYRAFFELPHNGPPGIAPDLVYSFEVGDVCFAVLDSTLAVSDPDAARRQAEWLDETLGRTRAAWKLVMFHHPVYPSHPWRDSPALCPVWVPIFDKHHVNLVLQGHDHAYLRTFPLRAAPRVERRARGRPMSSRSRATSTWTRPIETTSRSGRPVSPPTRRSEIDPETESASTIGPGPRDGRVIDEFAIEKSRTHQWPHLRPPIPTSHEEGPGLARSPGQSPLGGE